MSLDADIAALVEEAVSRATRPLREEVARLREAIEARWVTRAEQAEADCCSVDTVDRRVAAGALESRRIGRRVLVRPRPRPSDDQIAALAAEATR